MDELKALAKLVHDSVEEIEKSCKSRGVHLPSLSEPFTLESEAAKADPAFIQAAGNITAAAGQLATLVRPAPLTLFSTSIWVRDLPESQDSTNLLAPTVPYIIGSWFRRGSQCRRYIETSRT